ncbi:hypothetical protein [Cohnella faecalis]|uniref:Uncharacterized protein n=1 Tax=Cohnella faecalis TaxID=2315694 RepID=A0A398CNL6_9BACL|nr:hypothetical protein [Cohnella faecalis]RIE00504.1 hypothetical protein D3H35_28080 [Cohnella faecalis]
MKSGGNAEAVKEADASSSAAPRLPRQSGRDAFHGSVKAMLARTRPTWRAISEAIDGLSLLDEAVAASPQDVTIRILRAKSLIGFPSLYSNDETTIEDYVVSSTRSCASRKSRR